MLHRSEQGQLQSNAQRSPTSGTCPCTRESLPLRDKTIRCPWDNTLPQQRHTSNTTALRIARHRWELTYGAEQVGLRVAHGHVCDGVAHLRGEGTTRVWFFWGGEEGSRSKAWDWDEALAA
jgi:hypothetical protein